MIQEETAKDIARRLLAGDHYLITGREYMAKSLLLKLVVQTIEDQGLPDTRVVLVDFAREGAEGWLPVVTQKLLHGHEPVTGSDGLLPLVRMWHAIQPAAARLILVFDHVDRLAEETLGEFSRQCSSLVHELAAEPALATSMLWCGEEVAMEAAFKQTDAFVRRTREYRAAPYTGEEVDSILDECSRRRAFRFSAAEKNRVYELTGGLPALVRDVERSFTQQIVAAITDSLLLPNVVAETIEREIPGFVAAMYRDRDHFVHGPHDCYPAYVVSRIEHDERLLSLVFEMCQSRAQGSTFRFPAFSRHDEDLLVQDANGCVTFRGLLLDKFVRRVFDLRRLMTAFYFLDETPASFMMAQVCADLNGKDPNDVSPPALVSPRLGHKLLSHLAKRLHTAESETDILSLLGFTTRLLGWSEAAVLRCADAAYTIVDGIPNLEGDGIKRFLPDADQHALFIVDIARRDRHVHWDTERRMAVAPMTVEGVVRFILCVCLAHGKDEQENAEPEPEVLPEWLATLQTVAAMAEGPLGGIAARQRAVRELAERDRELAMLRGIPPLRAELRSSVEAIMANVLSAFSAMGLRVRIRVSIALFAKPLERASQPAPPVLSNEQDNRLSGNPKNIEWLEQDRGWGVLLLCYKGTHIGRIEFASRSSRSQEHFSAEALSALADEYAAHLGLLVESSRSWFYRFVFDNLTSGVQVLDRQLNILAMNRPLERVLRERDGFKEDWHGRRCYEVHRLPGQEKHCDYCTTWKAWESGREEVQLEQWPSRHFGKLKMLCHYVESTPIRDGGQIIGAVEISRPPNVGEVVAALSTEILSAIGRTGIMKVLAKACLMLGFDRCRFYWIDPFTDMIAPQVMTIPGKPEAVEIHDKPVDPHGEHAGSAAFLRMMESLSPSLLRRSGWKHEKAASPARIPSANVFCETAIPFREELEHGHLGELLMVPFVWQKRVLGFVAADYFLLDRPMDDDDTKHLREFASVATQFILTAERAEMNVNLAAVVAHQTTQPYNAIQANASEMVTCDDKDRRKALFDIIESTVMTSATAFKTRTNYLREFTRPEGPENLPTIVDEECKSTTIEALFDYVIAMFGALCRSKNIVLKKRVDKKSASRTFCVNISLIREALTNLVQNAVNALPKRLASGDEKRIELRATQMVNHVCLDISDNGDGILEKHWEDVFKPYFAMGGKGVGIGLTVVKRTLMAHGWDIVLVRPKSGFSTTFRITTTKEV